MVNIEQLVTEASSLLVRLKEIQEQSGFSLEAVPSLEPTVEAAMVPTYEYNPPNNYLNNPNPGATAWMLTATALVLFMTMPGNYN